MKTLHWVEVFYPHIGGAEVFSYHLCQGLLARGHECMVITDMGKDELLPVENVQGIQVHRFPFQWQLMQRDVGSILRVSQKAIQAARAYAPDVLHLHTNHPGAFYFLKLHQSLGLPTVFTTHNPVAPQGLGGDLLLRVLQIADQVAANSQSLFEDTTRFYPPVRQKILVIPNSLLKPGVSPSPIHLSEPVFFFAARLVPEKGGQDLLHAFASILPDFPRARLVIAGDGVDKPVMEQLADRLGLADRVEFLGWVQPEQVYFHINQASVVLMPSREPETFGLVALQGMQMARPVIASHVRGLNELVRHGETGLLVEPGNPVSLAGAMRRLLNDSQLAEQMGWAGLRLAETAYGWENCVNRYEEIYISLLSRQREGAT